MFDLGWSELAVIALVALIVVGPRELPEVLRTCGQWMRKLRSMAREFQTSLDEMVREAELDDARKAIESTSRFDIEKQIKEAVDPSGEVQGEVRELDRTVRSGTEGDGGAEEKTEEGAGASELGQPVSGAQPAPPHSIAPPSEATPVKSKSQSA